MKFSVLMSVYKNDISEYLNKAIESVLNQTIKPNEIVIVVDGPISIELKDILEKYKEKYDTIIVVAHKMAFQSICDCGDMKPAEIFETTF